LISETVREIVVYQRIRFDAELVTNK